MAGEGLIVNRTVLTSEQTGQLPRLIRADLLWTGGCVDFPFEGRSVHSHMSTYCLKGSERTILIDTGCPIHANRVVRDVEQFLGGRALDYMFLTHSEFPHDGLATFWLERYPKLRAVGDVRDYRLFFPELTDRMIKARPGDWVDLGDRAFVFVPAIWRDLKNTLWGYETRERTLFVSDGFSYLHRHEEGECDLLVSESGTPKVELIRTFNEATMDWINHIGSEATFDQIDSLLAILKPSLIASAHGAVIDEPGVILPLIKAGMQSSHYKNNANNACRSS